MSITRLPTDIPQASFSDSIAVEGSGRWIHLSGQVGLAPGAASCEGDVAAQTQLCLDRIEASLSRLGADLSAVVKMTAYLVDLKDYAAFSRVRAERFTDGYPASTGVQVAGLLLNAAIEIDAVAFVPPSSNDDGRHG